MTIEYGMMVEYRGIHGWINFVEDDYFTICFIDKPDRSLHRGRYQVNLLVFREFWHEVRCCVDETKKEQDDETTSYFLQSRGCDYVGAAC